jgi:oligogalacturonide transport system permease protein
MKSKNLRGLLFVMPWILGFLIFTAYPFITSLYLSFTDYSLLDEPSFIGLKNYFDLFQDKLFLKSLGNTMKYVFITVPIKLAFALFIAHILNYKLKAINFFRTAYYIPSILGGSVAIAVLWRFLFSDQGLVNIIIGYIGFEPISWLGDPRYALFTVSLLRAWQFGSAMVIFLAALKNIPESLYEAATIEGASKARMFISITIPMISPVIFFNFIMQLIQAFQEFNGPYIITGGGPLQSTTLLPLLIYNNAFQYYQMGYASAIAWILFLIIMVFTLISFRGQKYWVHYDDGEA